MTSTSAKFSEKAICRSRKSKMPYWSRKFQKGSGKIFRDAKNLWSEVCNIWGDKVEKNTSMLHWHSRTGNKASLNDNRMMHVKKRKSLSWPCVGNHVNLSTWDFRIRNSRFLILTTILTVVIIFTLNSSSNIQDWKIFQWQMEKLHANVWIIASLIENGIRRV